MRSIVTATTAALLALAPAPAVAQTPAELPRCSSAVADGTRVRVRLLIDGKRHAGRALGWATGTPVVVKGEGDTVVVGPHDRREVSAGRTANRAWQGLMLGLLVGNVSNVHCF